MSDDHLKADHKALNDAMRDAFKVTRVAVRPGMIRNTVNAAIRRAAGRDVAESTGPGAGIQTWASLSAMSDHGDERGEPDAEGTGNTTRASLGPPYEYHLRIPERLRRDGWWVGSTRASQDQASYQATILHDARPEIGRSRGWEPSREDAVDSAVRDLMRVLAP
jgi:hypothetical protein